MYQLTDNEYNILTDHIEEIERIVKNASASSVSTELLSTAITINKRLGYNDCSHCNSGMYRMITRVYSLYVTERSSRRLESASNKCNDDGKARSKKSKKGD